ncbi:MAG: hypothetical protein JXR49_03250 [Acidobacteria bacterium]|nr:hypothetical protein [Acidobacteriota bacterium]
MTPPGKKRSARELEMDAVSDKSSGLEVKEAPAGEAMAMLVRRGFRPESMKADLSFPEETDDASADRFAGWFGHYGFRLFLRGAIRKQEGFLPLETTRYLTREQSGKYAEVLVELGMAEKIRAGRYRLTHDVASFGAVLEWYVARELKRRFGFDVATGVRLHVPGGGGDLDVVAAAEGKLVYLELKSSPPRNLDADTAAAFWDRVLLLRPDLSLFVVDTALRLSDKILPMLVDAFPEQESGRIRPKKIGSRLWALTPHIYAVNGHRDLMANIGKAVAEGLRAVSPGILQP